MKECNLCPSSWRFAYSWSIANKYGKYDKEKQDVLWAVEDPYLLPPDLKELTFPGFLYKDDMISIFSDVDKDTPTHLLIFPIKHVEDLYILSHTDILKAALCAAEQLVERSGVAEAYISISAKKDGTSYVPHSHIHVQSQSVMNLDLLDLPPYFYTQSKYY